MPIRRLALCRCSCCGARAQASEMQRAALHTTSTAAGRTAGECQLATCPVISHVTSDRMGRVSNATCKHLQPTLLQEELQSDAAGAALEETNAQAGMFELVIGYRLPVTVTCNQ